jgi:hypothetical protein
MDDRGAQVSSRQMSVLNRKSVRLSRSDGSDVRPYPAQAGAFIATLCYHHKGEATIDPIKAKDAAIATSRQ